jgi:hypothetical protein
MSRVISPISVRPETSISVRPIVSMGLKSASSTPRRMREPVVSKASSFSTGPEAAGKGAGAAVWARAGAEAKRAAINADYSGCGRRERGDMIRKRELP